MIEPLDSEILRELECDEEEVGSYHIRSAKSFFAENDVIEGVRNLLEAFGRWRWRPHLYHDHSNREKWHIQFPVHNSVPHNAQLLTRIPGPTI